MVGAWGTEGGQFVLGGTPDPGWAASPTYYADVNYLGAVNSGTVEKPFDNLQEAIDLAWVEVSSLVYDDRSAVRVAIGDYSEVGLVGYPFVAVIGEDRDSTRISSTVAAQVVGNPGLFSFGQYNFENLRFMTAFAQDMTSVPFFGFDTLVRFRNCRFASTFDVEGLGAQIHRFEFVDCVFDGGEINLTNVSARFLNCISSSAMNVHGGDGGDANQRTAKDGTNYPAYVEVLGGTWSGDIAAKMPSGTEGTWLELAGRVSGEVIANGSGTTVETTSLGYPDGGLTLNTGSVRYDSGGVYGREFDQGTRTTTDTSVTDVPKSYFLLETKPLQGGRYEIGILFRLSTDNVTTDVGATLEIDGITGPLIVAGLSNADGSVLFGGSATRVFSAGAVVPIELFFSRPAGAGTVTAETCEITIRRVT